MTAYAAIPDQTEDADSLAFSNRMARLWLLALPDSVHLGATDGADTTGRGLPVLHGHLFRLLEFPLRSAL